MAEHMDMTALRPPQSGDKERAAAIVAAARKAADPYKDYHKALEDGYAIFLPEVKQNVYHFTNYSHSYRNTMNFDASRPTSLLYEKVPAKAGEKQGYKLVGVMYTAPYEVPEDELNRRVPLSIARWHLHTNLCVPLNGGDDADDEQIMGTNPKFGLLGSITTASACRAAGGRFMQHVFGWMVHVYPYETDPKKIWATGMDDAHGMQHEPMAGMPM
ncbi:MAG: hypothetical protein M3O31_12180 [Acidobacteriota bacterium]|nr:hypothetical protein [Acidobacteriota bacterium]